MTMNFIIRFLESVWDILAEAAPWIIVGFAAAALMKALVPDRFLARHLGGPGPGPVLKASLLGAPLPLCSCGVLPAAAGLRRQGAGRGATAAFLVSTPETGVDSMAVTWALLDPVMTVIRPLAAVLTATVAGLLVNMTPEPDADAAADADAGADAGGGGCSSGDSSGSCCAPAGAQARLGDLRSGPAQAGRLRQAFGRGLDYVWDEMLGDIGPWLAGGILVAAALSAALPQGILAALPGGEWTSLTAMLVVGVPLYVCATASTPVAAALALKGLSPGAALVLLLAGPATNAATIAVTARMLGRRAAAAILVSVAACSLALGWFVNRLYPALGLDTAHWSRALGQDGHGPLAVASAVVLGLALTARILTRKRRRAH